MKMKKLLMEKLILTIPRGRDVENWHFIESELSDFKPELKEGKNGFSIILYPKKPLTQNQILKLGATIGQWIPAMD
jgi:hypothetical protein